ncbi:MAG: class I SAM-dependent methyltransferase [Planctomycetota bacterium]
MRHDYAQHYRTLYEKHWWWRARESVLLREIERYARGRRDLRLLDVGCGDGLFFPKLKAFGEVLGVETDQLIVSDSNPDRASIHVGKLDEDCPHQGPFSIILMLDVLEHIEHPSETLRQATSLLADDGILLITVPAFQFLWTRHDEINHHYRRYTKTTINSLAAESGVQLKRTEYFFHWLVAAKLAVRFKEAVIAGEPSPAELSPAWVNRLLLGISKIERAMLGSLPLPVGSSLLAIGRRKPAL